MANNPTLESGFDEVSDACEETATGRLIERQNVREGAEKVAVLGGTVLSVAEVARMHYLGEELSPRKVITLPWPLVECGRPEGGIVVGVPTSVARLAFCEKLIGAITNTPRSFNDRQRAARAQRLRALLYSSAGIEPMKGGRGHDQIEWLVWKYRATSSNDSRRRRRRRVLIRHRPFSSRSREPAGYATVANHSQVPLAGIRYFANQSRISRWRSRRWRGLPVAEKVWLSSGKRTNVTSRPSFFSATNICSP